MTFDLDREFRIAESRVSMIIDRRAREAVRRLWEMHAVGMGYCYCGSGMEGHGWDDTHAPVEMMRDKSYGTDDTI